MRSAHASGSSYASNGSYPSDNSNASDRSGTKDPSISRDRPYPLPVAPRTRLPRGDSPWIGLSGLAWLIITLLLLGYLNAQAWQFGWICR